MHGGLNLLGGGRGANLYAYTESSPTNFRDPSGKCAFWHHYAMTKDAAEKAGLDADDAEMLARRVQNVDFQEGSQGTDAYHSNMHAMRGKKCNGKYQRCGEAYQGSLDQLSQAIDSPTLDRLAHALHMIQDAGCPAHSGYPEWCGMTWLVTTREGRQHLDEDANPGDAALEYGEAMSERFLRDMMDRTNLKPKDYLPPCPTI
jgi:hypothetical protein